MKEVIFLAFTCFMVVAMGCSNQKSKAENEPAAAPVTKSVQIQGAVGNLAAELQIPALKPNEKCLLVILMHGFMSSKDDQMIVQIANQLQEKGMASIRFDFNGHGSSDGKFVDMTVPLEVDDALSVFHYCQTLDFVSDIALLGHSQGGVVASLAGGELKDSVKSIVLMAPAAVLVDDSKKGSVMGTTFDPENVPESVDIFGHQLGRAYILSAQQLNIYDKADDYKGPVCIIHGKADQVVPYSYGEKYDEVYDNSTLHLLDGENHMFNQNQSLSTKIAVDFLVEQ